MEDQNESQLSEFDILEWISQLSNNETKIAAKERLMNAGSIALPWLVRSHSTTTPASKEIGEIIKTIISENGIPRKGRSEIKRIIGSA